jgi:hypothetical protein
MNTETNTATVTSTSTTKATRGPGRPKATLKYPRGSFTFAELFEFNRGEGEKPNVCKLTVRNHIKEKLSDGFLTKLKESVETGKPGQPAHRYIRTAVKAAADAARAARAAAAAAANEGGTTPTEAPVVEVSLTEATAQAVEVPSETEAVSVV